MMMKSKVVEFWQDLIIYEKAAESINRVAIYMKSVSGFMNSLINKNVCT